jgi:hypothetical protein
MSVVWIFGSRQKKTFCTLPLAQTHLFTLLVNISLRRLLKAIFSVLLGNTFFPHFFFEHGLGREKEG